jgi:probable HAF family extracellular repeat protein
MKSMATLIAVSILLAGIALGQPSRYTVTDLGPVGPPPGQAFFVTNRGLVSGTAPTPDGAEHAVLWYNQLKFDIGKPGLGGANSSAFSVNQTIRAVGEAETSAVDPNGEDFCGFTALGFPASGTCLPFVWQSGVMTPLPTLGGYNGAANMINNRGTVVGVAETNKTDPNCPAPQVLQFKPVIWRLSAIQELATFAGDPDGIAFAVNDNGDVGGASGDCSTFNPATLTNLQPLHALLWQNGRAIDLGNLGGTGHGFGNVALNLNSRGEVIGQSDLAGDQVAHAFLWTKQTGMRDLGTLLPGDVLSAALGINDNGDIVGISLDASFNVRPFLRRKRSVAMIDLNTLTPADSPLLLLLACSINSQGQITGLAVDKNTGEPHAYLATPTD